jgi:hypothetical protein
MILQDKNGKSRIVGLNAIQDFFVFTPHPPKKSWFIHHKWVNRAYLLERITEKRSCDFSRTGPVTKRFF